MAVRMNLFTRLRKTRIYKSNMNNGLPKRLNWEQIERQPRREGRKVVKGTAKRVIVVKSPDPKIFEQAIFIVKEDILGKAGTDPNDVLRQAQKVADDYIRSSVSKRSFFSKLPPAAFAALGAGSACIAWLLLNILGI